MILEQPNNILLKINTIQDNTNSQNKSKNSAFHPLNVQNSNKSFSPTNNTSIPILINSSKNDDSHAQPQFCTFQNNSMIQTVYSTSNIKFKTNNSINTSTNSLDDASYDNKNTYKETLRINQVKQTNDKENIKIKKKRKFKKFKICHIEYQNVSKDNNNRLKHKRKYKPDDIRKKIKARFHKSIKNIVNENLRKAGSKKLLTFLPQIFISSISREKNRNVMNLTLRELFQKNFLNNVDEKYKNKNVDLAKYKKNLTVLEYLDKNPEICRNSGFDIISKMKYSDLLDEYFKSDEFEKAILKLREENEDEDYIKEYIHKSKNYVKFFIQEPSKIKPDKFRTSEEDEKKSEDNK